MSEGKQKYTPEQVAVFESTYGISLPKAYRDALIYHGTVPWYVRWNGFSVPPLSRLEDWWQPHGIVEFVVKDDSFILVHEYEEFEDSPGNPSIEGMRIVHFGGDEYVVMWVTGDQAGRLSMCYNDFPCSPLMAFGHQLTIEELLNPFGGILLRIALFNYRRRNRG